LLLDVVDNMSGRLRSIHSTRTYGRQTIYYWLSIVLLVMQI
jgi:hypothetical protein